MWTRIKRWWEAEGAMVQLLGVSDRLLEDMGLDRETLAAQVRGHAHSPEAPAPLLPMHWPGRCQAVAGQACPSDFRR